MQHIFQHITLFLTHFSTHFCTRFFKHNCILYSSLLVAGFICSKTQTEKKKDLCYWSWWIFIFWHKMQHIIAHKMHCFYLFLFVLAQSYRKTCGNQNHKVTDIWKVTWKCGNTHWRSQGCNFWGPRLYMEGLHLKTISSLFLLIF